MPQKCETRAGKARATRNSFVGIFHDPFAFPALSPEAIEDLIAVNICERHFRYWSEGG